MVRKLEVEKGSWCLREVGDFHRVGCGRLLELDRSLELDITSLLVMAKE